MCDIRMTKYNKHLLYSTAINKVSYFCGLATGYLWFLMISTNC